jgi:hypothetical protein
MVRMSPDAAYTEPEFDRNDRGSGSLNDYGFNLSPRNRRKTLRLAGSNEYQQELQRIVDEDPGQLVTAGGRRTMEEERVDAPMPLRLFTGNRVSDVVGIVPRGLEPVVEAAVVRLEEAGKPPRIPVVVVKTRGGLRVDLLMGETRF